MGCLGQSQSESRLFLDGILMKKTLLFDGTTTRCIFSRSFADFTSAQASLYRRSLTLGGFVCVYTSACPGCAIFTPRPVWVVRATSAADVGTGDRRQCENVSIHGTPHQVGSEVAYSHDAPLERLLRFLEKGLKSN